MPAILYEANDNILRVTGATSISLETGLAVYLDAQALVTVTVVDVDTGEEIAGQTWPMALNYVAGSDGDYLAVLPDVLVVVPGQALRAHIELDNGANQHGELELDVLVLTRRR